MEVGIDPDGCTYSMQSKPKPLCSVCEAECPSTARNWKEQRANLLTPLKHGKAAGNSSIGSFLTELLGVDPIPVNIHSKWVCFDCHVIIKSAHRFHSIFRASEVKFRNRLSNTGYIGQFGHETGRKRELSPPWTPLQTTSTPMPEQEHPVATESLLMSPETVVDRKQNLNDMAGSSSSSSCDVAKLDVAKLECSVCHQQFKDPKILHCLHSFCQNCISLLVSDGPTKVIVCPLCSQETKVDCIDKLNSSVHLVEKLKGFRIQEQVTKSPKPRPVCESCNVKTRKVAARCLDCSMFLCWNCTIVHRRIAALSQHRVVSLGDLRSAKSLKTPRKETVHNVCTKHLGEKLKFYCKTCEEWVCRDCRVAEHGSEEHAVVDSDLRNSEGRIYVKICTARLEKAVTEFQSTLDTITKAGPEFNNHAAILLEDLKETADRMRKTIDTEETRLIEEIGRIRQEQEETLKGCTRKVNSAILEMKHALETANEITDVPSDQDFIDLLPIIKDELLRLLNIKRKPSDLYNGLPLMKVQCVMPRLGPVKMGSSVILPPPERRAEQANTGGSSKTSVPANPGGSSKTSVPTTPGVVLRSDTDPDLPGAKRWQITSKEASKQGDEARNVKRFKTKP